MTTDQIELETKIAFLEKTVAELGDTLYQQHKQLDVMQKKIDETTAQLKSFAEQTGIDPAFEKPPHY